MASLESVKMNKLMSQGIIINRSGQDTPVAIRLTYLGGGTVTSVVVTTGTGIVLTTSNGGADSYAFATFLTYGAVADAISADGIFNAKVLDCLRSKASTSTLLGAPTTLSAKTDPYGQIYYDVVQDTSTSLQYAACLSPHQFFGQPDGHRVTLQEIKYGINMGTAAVNSVQVWRRSKDGSETQVFGILSVDTTETTINWASGKGHLTGNTDDDIITIVLDAATMGDATTNYLQVVGVKE